MRLIMEAPGRYRIEDAPLRRGPEWRDEIWRMIETRDSVAAIFETYDGEDYEEIEVDLTQGNLLDVVGESAEERAGFIRGYVQDVLADREEDARRLIPEYESEIQELVDDVIRRIGAASEFSDWEDRARGAVHEYRPEVLGNDYDRWFSDEVIRRVRERINRELEKALDQSGA